MKVRVAATIALLLTLGAATLSGCSVGGSDASHAGNEPRLGATVAGPAVTIQHLAFTPRSITVKVGDTVTWTNKDTTTHTVTGTSFISGRLDPGATYSHKFDAAGTYQYICTIHPNMVGIVVVQ